MSLFLATFFLIYGSVHLYAFLRVNSALNLHLGAGSALAAFMLVMLSAPVLVRVLEGRGLERPAILLSQIGYLWMGLLFLFFVASILIDFYSASVHVAGRVSSRNFLYLVPSARWAFFIPLLVASAVFIYAYGEARDIRTENLTIASKKIPAEVGRLKIVQISDVHIGLMVRGRRLDSMIQRIKDANPDLIVSTGDLLDGQTDRIGKWAEALKQIRPRYGKFAIMGNHEYYSGFRQAHEFFKQADFTLLRGETARVAGYLNLAGFDDPAGRAWGVYRDIPPEYLKKLPGNGFALFLKHRPVVEENPGPFDLQLSGHTHQGQIFPFHFIIRLVFPRYGGFYPLPGNSYLYVNRGAGTWGPPIRFGSRPEITVIELIRGEKSENARQAGRAKEPN